ncbi:MAG: PIN domain-containing protein [Syntrophales bacterium]|nr:PIN domain-containing protein [Syntrophales bacterium]
MKSPAKTYLADTNVVLRYLLGDHPEFSPRADAFFQDVYKGVKKAEILDVVIVECVYVMEKYYGIPKAEIAAKLSGILNFQGIVNTAKSQVLSALLKYEATNADIVDCILAAASTESRAVVSFDSDMKKLKAVTESL